MKALKVAWIFDICEILLCRLQSLGVNRLALIKILFGKSVIRRYGGAGYFERRSPFICKSVGRVSVLFPLQGSKVEKKEVSTTYRKKPPSKQTLQPKVDIFLWVNYYSIHSRSLWLFYLAPPIATFCSHSYPDLVLFILSLCCLFPLFLTALSHFLLLLLSPLSDLHLPPAAFTLHLFSSCWNPSSSFGDLIHSFLSSLFCCLYSLFIHPPISFTLFLFLRHSTLFFFFFFDVSHF